MVRAAAIGLATLAAAAVALGAPGVPGGGEDGIARPEATLRSGSFAQGNSRSGMPVFSAANLGPGDSTTGSVRITNTGTLGAGFTLSAYDVADVPGPNGGLLSNRLRLAVLDVTRSVPATVYSGPLAAMPARPLGRFAPSEARTYRFTASFPDGGSPASAAGGDNAYTGSSVSASFRWSAVGEDGLGSRADGGDRRPPRLRLSIPRIQRVLSRGYLVLRARCDEACRVGVTGTVRIGRGRATAVRPIRSRRLAKGKAASLRIRLPARARGTALRRALLGDRGVTVRLRVVARDRAGNRTVARRTVRLSRR